MAEVYKCRKWNLVNTNPDYLKLVANSDWK